VRHKLIDADESVSRSRRATDGAIGKVEKQ
jgi:hypothetical protein